MMKILKKKYPLLAKYALLLLPILFCCAELKAQIKPNIIYILTDDLGYGDVKYLNPKGKIATPNMDMLGKQGMAFTDAHSSSAVCTPSRYSILTGRYAWRTKLQSSVLYGFDAPLIDSNRYTVADMLKENGYQTACIGKWHLGLGWQSLVANKEDTIDYSKAIIGGPNVLGFDYFYGISASLDMPPYIYIENDHTVGLPTVTKAFHRKGVAEKDFEAVNCVPDLTNKAVKYINDKSKIDNPFFLYFALPSPHTPIAPNANFKGKSGVTDYGDYVVETDWSIGEILKAVEANGIAENTIIILTSDNGFAGYVLDQFDVEKLGHMPSADFRGYKAGIWEGGHRIPFIVRWPTKIKAGSFNNKTICLSDFMATMAAITGAKVKQNSAEDSYNILPYFIQSTKKNIRETTIHHSIFGYFSIRKGKWKLALCPGSGAGSGVKPDNKEAYKKGLPLIQLYNMDIDKEEKNNVEAKYPEVVKELTGLLEKYVKNGRSTPGQTQKNDVVIDIWKKNYIKN